MQSRHIHITGLTVFGVCTFFSILFFMERTVFTDMAFHIFSIVKDGDFAVQNMRFAALFTQLFPLTAVKLGASLQTVALVYSLGFAILYLLTFIILSHKLKQPRWALAWLLFSTVITTHGFYWIQPELPQGMAFLFILLAWMERLLQKNTAGTRILPLLMVLLLCTVSFAHPLLLFAFLFGIIFLWFQYGGRWQLWQAVMIYLLCYAVRVFILATPYDQEHFAGLAAFKTRFPDYITLQSNKNLFRYIVNDYYMLPLVMGACTLYYIRRKAVKQICLLLLSAAGYTLLINITHAGGAQQFYMENQYMVLAFFAALPAAMNWLPAIKKTAVAAAIVAAVCGAALFRIYNTHHIYTQRLNWCHRVLEQTSGLPGQKIIIPLSSVPLDTVLMTWGSSYEFWLLSTVRKNASASIIIEERPGEFDWAAGKPRHFIGKWGIYPYDKLNPVYFKFSDTGEYYKYSLK